MATKKELRKSNVVSKKKSSVISGQDKKLISYCVPIILLLTVLSYLPVFNNSFTNWDDNSYIQNNILIRTINLKDIFSTNLMGNYHPLTILVYAIEFHYFNLDELGYYVVNLIIHLLNTLLVARVIFNLSNKIPVALVASLLFGIHPIHVESVAWASELKDLLYTFFFLYSYSYYLKYIGDQKKKYYNLSIIFFLLSLLSKAMAASLPVLLLLTDFFKGRKINSKTIIEKVPYFILAIIFGLVAVIAQQSFGSTESTVFNFPYRLIFASYAFVTYLVKLIFPLTLCPYYAYPIIPGGSMPPLYFIYPVILLLLIVATVYFRNSYKKIFFGISFFAITIFLVLQIFPVGDTIMADRYCYIPSIGLFYIAGEGISRLWERKNKFFPILLLCIFITFFSVKTFSMSRIWENSMTLWNEVIRQNENAAVAYSNRGYIEMNAGKIDEALRDFNKAIELKPDYSFAYNNRAVVMKKLNRIDNVLHDLNKAIEIKPDYVDALNNRGIVFTSQKKYDEAIVDFNKAIELQPTLGDAHLNRGIAEFNSGKTNDACVDFQKAARLGVQKGAELYSTYCH